MPMPETVGEFWVTLEWAWEVADKKGLKASLCGGKATCLRFQVRT